MTATRAPLCIPADHPSLPGHFPGQPVVPGAVLLAQVAALAGRGARRVSGFGAVKFVSPLLPEQAAEILLTARDDASLAFEIVAGTRRIASGALRLAPR
jgi:3-hydroxymyristoyl/3-hydroxydecanoyl-(acyl carrier protein) dehydratase